MSATWFYDTYENNLGTMIKFTNYLKAFCWLVYIMPGLHTYLAQELNVGTALVSFIMIITIKIVIIITIIITFFS